VRDSYCSNVVDCPVYGHRVGYTCEHYDICKHYEKQEILEFDEPTATGTEVLSESPAQQEIGTGSA